MFCTFLFYLGVHDQGFQRGVVIVGSQEFGGRVPADFRPQRQSLFSDECASALV